MKTITLTRKQLIEYFRKNYETHYNDEMFTRYEIIDMMFEGRIGVKDYSDEEFIEFISYETGDACSAEIVEPNVFKISYEEDEWEFHDDWISEN